MLSLIQTVRAVAAENFALEIRARGRVPVKLAEHLVAARGITCCARPKSRTFSMNSSVRS